jgi:metal-dependent amidase/aminoacylase/carboxypeptidase family protein
MKTNDIKPRIKQEIEAQSRRLREIALSIHSCPELGFKEEKSAAVLTGYLKENGFTVETGICQLPTAFRASYGNGKPNIAILAEYDALPGSATPAGTIL